VRVCHDRAFARSTTLFLRGRPVRSRSERRASQATVSSAFVQWKARERAPLGVPLCVKVRKAPACSCGETAGTWHQMLLPQDAASPAHQRPRDLGDFSVADRARGDKGWGAGAGGRAPQLRAGPRRRAPADGGTNRRGAGQLGGWEFLGTGRAEAHQARRGRAGAEAERAAPRGAGRRGGAGPGRHVRQRPGRGGVALPPAGPRPHFSLGEG
jgi:hypothetical protein